MKLFLYLLIGVFVGVWMLWLFEHAQVIIDWFLPPLNEGFFATQSDAIRYGLAVFVLIVLFLGFPPVFNLAVSPKYLFPLKKIINVPPTGCVFFLGVIAGFKAGVFLYFPSYVAIIFTCLAIFILMIKHYRSANFKLTRESKDCYEQNDPSSQFLLLEELNDLYRGRKIVSDSAIQECYSRFVCWSRQEKPLRTDTDDFDLFQMEKFGLQLASKLLDSDPASRVNQRLGIIGSFGSGKSSLVHFVKKGIKLKGGECVIVCTVNLWRCKTSREAEKYILEKLLERLGHFFDVFMFSNLPQLWAEISEVSPKAVSLVFTYLFNRESFEQTLNRLGNTLRNLDLKLVLIVEDIDRPQDHDYCPKQIQALLEKLKVSREEGGLDCSIIITGNRDSLDFSRLCEFTVTPPPISVPTFEKILWLIISCHLDKSEASKWSLLYGDASSKTNHGADTTSSILSILDIAILIKTPRQLKLFLRHLDAGWSVLRGEVDYYDFFLLTLLRATLPDSFDFINANIEKLQSLSKFSELSDNKNQDEIRAALKKPVELHLQKLSKDDIAVKQALLKMLVLLFGSSITDEMGASEKRWLIHFFPAGKTQRVNAPYFPTNYWNRVFSESLPVDEVHDQVIIKTHRESMQEGNSVFELVDLIADEQTEIKWIDLQLYIPIEKQRELTSALFISRCRDRDGSIQVVSMTTSIARGRGVLKELNQRTHNQLKDLDYSIIQSHFNWVKDTFHDLIKVNIQAAFLFAFHWTCTDNQVISSISDDQWTCFQDIMQESLKNLAGESNPKFANLLNVMPKDDFSSLSGLLKLMSLKKSRQIVETPPIAPVWLQQAWYEALSNKNTCNDALVLFAKGIFRFNQLDKLYLQSDFVAPLMGKYSEELIRAVAALDFSHTSWREHQQTIAAECYSWLDKRKSDPED